jgi:hypothetical protein
MHNATLHHLHPFHKFYYILIALPHAVSSFIDLHLQISFHVSVHRAAFVSLLFITFGLAFAAFEGLCFYYCYGSFSHRVSFFLPQRSAAPCYFVIDDIANIAIIEGQRQRLGRVYTVIASTSLDPVQGILCQSELHRYKLPFPQTFLGLIVTASENAYFAATSSLLNKREILYFSSSVKVT